MTRLTTIANLKGPQGDEGPTGDPSTWLKPGTGFPEGVVTAPVGTRYIDTAATNGAVEWIKVSGTGNTGWRVTYGDSGWRSVYTAAADGTVTQGALGAEFAPRSGSAVVVKYRVTTDVVRLLWDNVAAATSLAAGSHLLIPTATLNLSTIQLDAADMPAVLAAGKFGSLWVNSAGITLRLSTANTFATGDLVTDATGHEVRFPRIPGQGWPATLPGTPV